MDVTYDFSSDRPIYSQMMAEKQQGKQHSRLDIDRETLAGLWADELVSDRDIAQLFNCSEYEVRMLRGQYGLTNKACIKAYAQKAFSVLGKVGASIMML